MKINERDHPVRAHMDRRGPYVLASGIRGYCEEHEETQRRSRSNQECDDSAGSHHTAIGPLGDLRGYRVIPDTGAARA